MPHDPQHFYLPYTSSGAKYYNKPLELSQGITEFSFSKPRRAANATNHHAVMMDQVHCNSCVDYLARRLLEGFPPVTLTVYLAKREHAAITEITVANFLESVRYVKLIPRFLIENFEYLLGTALKYANNLTCLLPYEVVRKAKSESSGSEFAGCGIFGLRCGV